MSQIKHGIWPYLSHRPSVWHLCVKTQGLWDKRLCVLLSSLVFRLFRYNILSHKMDGASLRRPLIIYYGIQDGCTHALWILISTEVMHNGNTHTYTTPTRTHPNTHALTNIGTRVGAFNDAMFTRVIQDRSLGERNVCCYPSDWYPRTRVRKSEWVCVHKPLKKMTSQE